MTTLSITFENNEFWVLVDKPKEPAYREERYNFRREQMWQVYQRALSSCKRLKVGNPEILQHSSYLRYQNPDPKKFPCIDKREFVEGQIYEFNGSYEIHSECGCQVKAKFCFVDCGKSKEVVAILIEHKEEVLKWPIGSPGVESVGEERSENQEDLWWYVIKRAKESYHFQSASGNEMAHFIMEMVGEFNLTHKAKGQSDSVEFAEWANDNDWYHQTNERIWLKHLYNGEREKKSSSDLFKDFQEWKSKQQKA